MENTWDITGSETQLLFSEIYDLNSDKANHSVEQKVEDTTLDIDTNDIYVVCDEDLSTEELDFVAKVMQAVNKSDQDYRIGPNDSTPTTAKIVLHFGNEDGSKTLYTPILLKNQTHCYFDSVKTLMAEKSKKRQLWECLKIVFKTSQ